MNIVMTGLDAAIHVLLGAIPQGVGCPGDRRAEATPSFRRLCPGMTSLMERRTMTSHVIEFSAPSMILRGATPRTFHADQDPAPL